jgi:Mg-chelatase subunit ChlD
MKCESWVVLGVAFLLGLGAAAPDALVRAQVPSLLPPLDVVLVLDQSGSMKQSDPERVLLQAVGAFVGGLRDQDGFGLVLFGGQARAAYPLNLLTSDATRREALGEVNRVRYGESRTNIAAGVERGLYELRQRGRIEAAPVLVFLTDGIMDTGSRAKDAEMRVWLRGPLLSEARERGVRVFSIALTEQADYVLMQEIAAATKGDYFRALQVGEVAGIFAKIHARLTPAPSSPSPPPAPALTMPPPAPSAGQSVPWIWIAAAATGILVLLLGVMVARRRLRPAGRRGSAESSILPTPAPSSPLPAAPRSAPAYLWDQRSGRSIPLAVPLTRIGRGTDNDMVIAEPQVSAHHAEIGFRQGHYYLRDLRSTNGTWVNQQRIKAETMLKANDAIRFDEFVYTFFEPERQIEGTIMRDFGKEIMMRESVRPRQAPSSLAETAMLDTVNDAVDLSRCPSHPSFEATEQCERCGRTWCALCNPPVSGERICRICRGAERHSGRGSSAQVGGSASTV